MIVCLTIYRLTGRADGRGYASYDSVADALEGVLTPQMISADLDYLFDLGIIDWKWVPRDGVWAMSFRVSEEAEGFVESAYRRSDFGSRDGR